MATSNRPIVVTWSIRAGGKLVLGNRSKAARSVNKSPIAEPSRNWIDSIVGAFDNNPVYERVMANAKAYRERLEQQLETE